MIIVVVFPFSLYIKSRMRSISSSGYFCNFTRVIGVIDINTPTVVSGIFTIHCPVVLFHVPNSVGFPIFGVWLAASNHDTVSSSALYVFIGKICTVSLFAIPIFILSGVFDSILVPVVCPTIILLIASVAPIV